MYFNQLKSCLYDRNDRYVNFEESDPVWVNNLFNKGFTAGKIVGKNGTYSFVAEVNGIKKCKHGDQIETEVGIEQPPNRKTSEKLG